MNIHIKAFALSHGVNTAIRRHRFRLNLKQIQRYRQLKQRSNTDQPLPDNQPLVVFDFRSIHVDGAQVLRIVYLFCPSGFLSSHCRPLWFFGEY